MAKAADNKWLRVNPDVVLSPAIEPVIVALDGEFERAQLLAFVTSGVRDRQKQLAAIRNYAMDNGLRAEFPVLNGSADLDAQVVVGTQMFPLWQVLWSRLLTMGVLINPPQRAPVLFRYQHPVRKVWIEPGTVIPASAHFYGTAFDVGARTQLDEKLAVIETAKLTGRVQGIIGITPEHANHAIHIDCV